MPCVTEDCELCDGLLSGRYGASHYTNECPHIVRYRAMQKYGKVKSVDEYRRRFIETDPAWRRRQKKYDEIDHKRRLADWTGAVVRAGCVDLHGVVKGQLWCWRLKHAQINKLVAKHGRPQKEQP